MPERFPPDNIGRRDTVCHSPQEREYDFLKMIDEQLKIIGPSLRDFVHQVIREQPDVLVFMDKGARLFGTPIKKYLETLKLSKMPEIRFYNDHDLKGKYILQDKSMLSDMSYDQIVQNDFSDLKNKKVFFFDETYSSGKGAAALKLAKNQLENDEIYYFALTRDPEYQIKENRLDEFALYGISVEDHEKILEEIESDPKFRIYDNPIPTSLFSKKASSLYVDEVRSQGRTVTVHTGSPKTKRIITEEAIREGRKPLSIPNAYKYTGESAEEIRRKNYEMVATIKNKIYKTLKHE